MDTGKVIMHNALMSLLEKWEQFLDNHAYTGSVIIDLSKAFHSIKYELLVAKLIWSH